MMFQIVFHILSLVLETIKKANSTGFIPVYNSRMYSKKNLDFLFLFFFNMETDQEFTKCNEVKQ